MLRILSVGTTQYILSSPPNEGYHYSQRRLSGCLSVSMSYKPQYLVHPFHIWYDYLPYKNPTNLGQF